MGYVAEGKWLTQWTLLAISDDLRNFVPEVSEMDTCFKITLDGHSATKEPLCKLGRRIINMIHALMRPMVVQDIDLEYSQRDHEPHSLRLVGPLSGCGKSTFFYVLLRVFDSHHLGQVSGCLTFLGKTEHLATMCIVFFSKGQFINLG